MQHLLSVKKQFKSADLFLSLQTSELVEYQTATQGIPANWQQLSPISPAQAQQLDAEPANAFAVSHEEKMN